MSETNRKPRVAISIGDINGIGCEIIMKTLADQHILEICTPVVFGSGKVTAYYRKVLNIQNFNSIQIRDASETVDRKINIVSCLPDDIKVEFGQSTETAGKASLQSLQSAVTAVKQGNADVLLTAPVNKYNMQCESFGFPGQTEYLQDTFGASEVLMFMVSESLRIGTVTGHMALRDVPEALTAERIIAKLSVMHQSMARDFAVPRPKIAVLALNPHAGENGLLGTEESGIIAPAIAAANAKGILAFGPFSPDGFFASDSMRRFDAVLAMYHDQAMLPFKLMNCGTGVNFTAGLPVVRTSPAHGTAYDLAGRNEASCQSFRDALYAACDIFRRRSSYAATEAQALKDTRPARHAAVEEKDEDEN